MDSVAKSEEKMQNGQKSSGKYSWLKTILVVFLLVICVDELIYLSVHKNATAPATRTQTQTSQTPTPTVDPTKNWVTYSSSEGKFSIKYPSSYLLTDNSASTASIRLLSNIIPSLNTNYRMTIQYKTFPGSPSLNQLISKNSPCTQITPQNGTPSTLNGESQAQIYIDTPCGQYVTTVAYTINDNVLYIITIETNGHFSDVKPYADAVLSTMRFN